MTTFTCQNPACGKEKPIRKKGGKNKYCSLACKAAVTKKVKKPCEVCGTPMEVYQSVIDAGKHYRKNAGRFCSQPCYWTWRRNRLKCQG